MAVAVEATGLLFEHVPAGQNVKLAVQLLVDGLPAADDDLSPWPTATVTVGDDASVSAARSGNVFSAVVTTPSVLGVVEAVWEFSANAESFVQGLEVVGARVATEADLNAALQRGDSPSNYSMVARRIALQHAVEAFERESGDWAFSPRRRTETVVADRHGQLRPNRPGVTIVEVDGVETSSLAASVGAHEVTYTFGRSSPPAYVSRAVALLASSILADGPWDDRGYAVSDDAGAFRLLTAGVSGAAFSIPEVQAALTRVRSPWLVR